MIFKMVDGIEIPLSQDEMKDFNARLSAGVLASCVKDGKIDLAAAKEFTYETFKETHPVWKIKIEKSAIDAASNAEELKALWPYQ